MPHTTTITILEARLRLVHIPRTKLQDMMSPILDCWWFRGEKDPFFALCLNGVEVSLFADAGVVSRTFGQYVEDPTNDGNEGNEKHDSHLRHTTRHVDEDANEEEGEECERNEQDDEEEALAGESGFTVGRGEGDRSIGVHAVGWPRIRTRDEDEGGGQERVKVGDKIWVVLEIAFHGDGWEEAGQRVRDISSPLADEGISILFLSTYISDYILVTADRLSDVTSILERSGFQFTTVEDDDDEPCSPGIDGLLQRARATSSSTHKSSDRGGGGGGSLAGSLIFSDRGSIGGSPAGSRGSVSATMSRSDSTNLPSAKATAFPLGSGSSPFSSSSNSPVMSPIRIARGVTSSPSKSPRVSLRAPVSELISSDSLEILPDELVCVGLSLAHEQLWRSKVVEAVFFPRRVLPLPGPRLPKYKSVKSLSRNRSPNGKGGNKKLSQPSYDRTLSAESTSTASSLASSMTSTSSSISVEELSNHLHSSNLAASVSTEKSRPPEPFIALTQTPDGASLTADVRILRAIFKEDEESDMVFAVGNGGLRGIWQGEDDEDDGEEDEDDDEDEATSDYRNRTKTLGQQLHQAEGKRVKSTLSRGRPKERELSTESSDLGRALAYPSELEEDEEQQQQQQPDLEDWEKIHLSPDEEQRLKERRERKEQAKAAGEGGRRLLKCLQLDLVSFGLDKHGIVEHFAGLLIEGGVNLLYQSTFQSANILVAKADINRAQLILKRHGSVP